MGRKNFFIIAVCLLAVFSAVADPVVIVENGEAKASIVTAEKPFKAAQLGAFELRHVIRLITGTELPITKGKPLSGTFPIYVGESSGTISLGMKTQDYKGESYEVKFFPGAIVLMGGDLPETGKVDYDNPATFPRTRLNYYATLFAVYDFLEKGCGVRFYMPGDLGVAFTPRKTLSVKAWNTRRAPSVEGMRASTMGVPWRKKHFSTARDRALLKYRWRMNTLYGQADHNTYGIYYRYWKKSKTSKPAASVFIEERPEFFARGYEGKSAASSPYVFPNDRDLPPNLCFTNREVIRILADQAIRAARGENIPWTEQSGMKRIPGVPYTYPMLTEDNNLYCKCSKCAALVPAGISGAARRTWFYYGFINALCREVAKRDPSISIASGVYACPMQDVPLEKNMSLQLMFGINTWYLPVIRNRHMEIYRYWKKKAASRPVTLWLYMLSPYWDMLQNDKPKRFFPGFYPHGIVPIARMFVNDGIKGWFSETFIDYSYLETYLALAICYDREFPAEKEIDAFFPNFFGAAAVPMREYWNEIEQAFWNEKSYPPHVRARYSGILNIWNHTYEVNWGLGTRERVAKLDALFRKAQAAAATPLEKARVEFVGKTIHYQMLEGRREFEKYLSILKNPLPSAVVPIISPAGGDPLKVNYSGQAMTIGPFRTIYDRPDSGSITVSMAHDTEYFYLFFREKTLPSAGVKNEWSDNAEIFFAREAGKYPYHHFVITPEGKLMKYLHAEENGVVRNTRISSGGKFVSGKDERGDWSFKLAVPVAEILPDGTVEGSGSFRMNMMRTRPDTLNASWSPLFDGSYLATLHRMGWVTLSGSSFAEADVKGDFCRSTDRLPDRSVWSFWSPVKDDPRISVIPGKGLKLSGGTSDGGMILRCMKKIPAAAGNRILFKFTASGKGKNLIRISYHENLPSDRTPALYKQEIGSKLLPFSVTEAEQEFILRTDVVNPAKGRTTHVNFWIWTPKNAELLMKEISVFIEPPGPPSLWKSSDKEKRKHKSADAPAAHQKGNEK